MEWKNLPDTSTPITAENLNNNVMTAVLSGDGHVIAQTNTYEKLEMSLYNSVGDKLTFDSTNNAIKIGAGVNKVKISFVGTNDCAGGGGRKYFQAHKNSSSLIPTLNYGVGTLNPVQVIQIPIVFSVSENDLITLWAYATQNDKILGSRTFMTVEVIG